MENTIRKVLTIAGSDSIGGAGIQADIKTVAAYKAYAMSVITALTAQNTTGVYGVFEADASFVGQQIDCVFTDVVPDAVKIGMVSNVEIIQTIADRLRQYGAKNIVLDPVMVATSGSRLLNGNAVQAIIANLFPLARIITPNIPEAEVLWGNEIHGQKDMLVAAKAISLMLQGGVLIKGGHLPDSADDLLYLNQKAIWIRGERIERINSHGTGCTLSSAIACNLAYGLNLEESVRNAKRYIAGALDAVLNLGNGQELLDHMYMFREKN